MICSAFVNGFFTFGKKRAELPAIMSLWRSYGRSGTANGGRLGCLLLHRRKRPLSDGQGENENDFKEMRSHAGSGHTLEDQVDHAPKDDGAPAGVPLLQFVGHWRRIHVIRSVLRVLEDRDDGRFHVGDLFIDPKVGMYKEEIWFD